MYKVVKEALKKSEKNSHSVLLGDIKHLRSGSQIEEVQTLVNNWRNHPHINIAIFYLFLICEIFNIIHHTRILHFIIFIYIKLHIHLFFTYLFLHCIFNKQISYSVFPIRIHVKQPKIKSEIISKLVNQFLLNFA